MLSREVSALEQENEALKKTIEELSKKIEASGNNPKACKHCKFFYRHYIESYGRYFEIEDGHCSRGKSCKERKREETCDFFEYGRKV